HRLCAVLHGLDCGVLRFGALRHFDPLRVLDAGSGQRLTELASVLLEQFFGVGHHSDVGHAGLHSSKTRTRSGRVANRQLDSATLPTMLRNQATTSSAPLRSAASRGVKSSHPTQFSSAPLPSRYSAT